MTTLIKNARAIVTVDDADRVLWNANILVDGCEIKYIGTENMKANRVIDASGCCVSGAYQYAPSPVSDVYMNLPVQRMELFCGWAV